MAREKSSEAETDFSEHVTIQLIDEDRSILFSPEGQIQFAEMFANPPRPTRH